MRIIHEITVPVQTSMGPTPYSNRPGVCGYNGIRVELFMVNSPSANFRDDAKLVEPLDKEIIEIEGPLEVVLDSFRQVVSILESTKKLMQQEMGLKRLMDCPNCDEDSKDRNACHTWECQAKWSEVARKQITDCPELVQRQKELMQEAAIGLEIAHADCGGSGCHDCEWTGVLLCPSKLRPVIPAQPER